MLIAELLQNLIGKPIEIREGYGGIIINILVPPVSFDGTYTRRKLWIIKKVEGELFEVEYDKKTFYFRISNVVAIEEA